MGEHRERHALRLVGCWLLMLLLVLAVDAQRPPPMTTLGTRTHFSIQGGPKKWGHRLIATILSNLNRFKFFSLEDS